jgi:hypothetical protein
MADVTTDRKNGGMPEWALVRSYWVNNGGRRFLTRLILVRTPFGGVEVTRIHTDDNARPHPHDHSRSFVSFKLGSYDEWVYHDPGDLAVRRFRRHRRLSAHLMRVSAAHTITRVSPRLVTVTLLGPRRQRSSYWTPDGKRPSGANPDREGGDDGGAVRVPAGL